MNVQAQPKKLSKAQRILLVVGIVLVVLVGACVWYVNDYYHADATALAAVADDDGAADGVTVRTLADGSIAFVPAHPTAGLIFYPGGKVQPEAYAPLLERCAGQGILCVLVKPLFNLAILDTNAADGIQEQFPAITYWIIAGHSVGGVAASDYVSHHEDSFDAIVFLAAYPSADLKSFAGSALSITGGNDQVLKRDKYNEAQVNLPSDAHELEIVGGNHAYYGNYGEQAGDGTATITREEQQAQTTSAIVELARVA